MHLTTYFVVLTNLIVSVFVLAWAVPLQSSTVVAEVAAAQQRGNKKKGIDQKDVEVHFGGKERSAADSAFPKKQFMQLLGEQVNDLYDSGFIPREKDCVFVADDRDDNTDALGGPNIYAAYFNEKDLTFVPVPYTIRYTGFRGGAEEYDVYCRKSPRPKKMMYLNSYSVVVQVLHTPGVQGTTLAVYKQHITVPYDVSNGSYVVPTKQFAGVVKKAYEVLGKKRVTYKISATHVVRNNEGRPIPYIKDGIDTEKLRGVNFSAVNNIVELTRKKHDTAPLDSFADTSHFLIKARRGVS